MIIHGDGSEVFLLGGFMKFIQISDESGDNGVKLKNQNGMTAYKVIVSMMILEEEIQEIHVKLTDIFKKISANGIRKWNKISTKKRNNPNFMEDFINEIFKSLEENHILFSIGIIDKKYYKDPLDVRDDTIKAYIHTYKRIFPFIKRFNYHTYIKNTIDWYIDIAGDWDFIQSLRDKSEKLSKDKKIDLTGPIFINKPENVKTSKEKIISELIAFVDFIAGVLNRFLLKYYQLDCKLYSCFNNCYNIDSQKGVCDNNYSKIWSIIINETQHIDILYNKKKIWNWQNLFYYPNNAFLTEQLSYLINDEYFSR